MDGRADLFSLGVMLEQSFPAVTEDPKWSDILRKLRDPTPGSRFPHATAVRDALAETFGPASPLDTFPSFGAGPLRGRDHELGRLTKQMFEGRIRSVLVQARPGLGLSRFLRQAVLAVAEAEGPPARVVDLGDLPDDGAWARALDWAASLPSKRGALLLGVNDPSPGLHWLPSNRRRRLARILDSSEWKRLRLRPVDVESLGDIVAANLGPDEHLSDGLAREILERTEADLSRVADGLRCLLEHAGHEDESHWRLDPADLPEALAACPGTRPSPSLGDIPARFRASLTLCAQAGPSFPERVAHGLLDQFGKPSALAELVDHGYLLEAPGKRLEFITRHLWNEAAVRTGQNAAEVDHWLHREHAPDPDRAGEVMRACLRARRLGDDEHERRWICQALKRADAQRRWIDVLRLLAFPDPPPSEWTTESARERVKALAGRLGERCSEDHLLLFAGSAVNAYHRGQGLPLIEEAARSRDASAAVPALFLLAARVAVQFANPAYGHYAQALRRLEHAPGGGSAAGILDYFEARRLESAGKHEEAAKLARRSVRRLRGTGDTCEPLSAQLLAVSQFWTSPAAAASTLRKALAGARDAEQEAQLSFNLSVIYGKMGRPLLAARLLDSAIRSLAGRMSVDRQSNLRLQRAWISADLDQVGPALKEAQALLQLPPLRLPANQKIYARLLLGFCFLHRGSGDDAIRETAQAWYEAVERGRVDIATSGVVTLIDTLIDLRAWDLVRLHASEIVEAETGQDAAGRVVAARVRALVVQEAGDSDGAVGILREQRPGAESLSDTFRTARYFHQFGLALLSRGGPDDSAEAVECFLEEIRVLPASARGYHRARALLWLSEALRLAGRQAEATATLDSAVALARRIESRGLLAECLRHRASRRQERTR